MGRFLQRNPPNVEEVIFDGVGKTYKIPYVQRSKYGGGKAVDAGDGSNARARRKAGSSSKTVMANLPIKFWVASLFVIVTVIWASSWLLVYYYLPGWPERSSFGDMFGAVNSLFSALAFAALVVAIYLQTQELGLQRQELKETREELKRTAEAQEKSEKALTEQVGAMNRQATAIYQYIQNWQESNRPIVTARVTTHSGGNVSTSLDIIVENTGNRPARNIRLSVNPEALNSALNISDENVLKAHIQRIFSEEGAIPVLANGRSITNSFGFVGKGSGSSDATWKFHSRFDVTVSYEDLEGKTYEHSLTLYVADDTGFAGSFWSKQDKPDPVAAGLKELVRIQERVEDELTELIEWIKLKEHSPEASDDLGTHTPSIKHAVAGDSPNSLSTASLPESELE